MPHRFEGKYNYFELPNNSGPIPPGREDDMELFISENGEVDEQKSNQGSFNKIDGRVTDTIFDLDATDDGNKVKRKLKGKVFLEKMIGGVLHVVVVGGYKDDDATKAQDEGTWVITKP